MAGYDYNIVVIGAGSAGLVSAYIAAATQARVALVEKHKMGGDCLNTGCVPSKALIKAAKLAHQAKNSASLGINTTDVSIDFQQAMAHVHSSIKAIEPHDSIERYTELGVECFTGEATIVDPHTVAVGDKKLTTRAIIIASGARPFIPPIPGIDSIDYLDSDKVWLLKELPKKLLVVGGGPIGCELAQAFSRLGSEVTIADMADKLVSREDPEVSEYLQRTFQSEGIQVMMGHRLESFKNQPESNVAIFNELNSEELVEVEFDKVLIASGRKANSSGFGLEKLGVELTETQQIRANPFLQTNIPNIYVCGDATGPYQFTHTAAHQAWYACVNALFSPFKQFRVDYRVIPWATFTDPEIARVGLNETEARAQGIDFEVTRYELEELDRAITDNAAHGFVKVITPRNKDKILGVTIVGEHASDMIPEFILAMRHNLGLGKILGTIHIYPTLSEANKFTAGNWRKNHLPELALKLVRKFHDWRR